MMETTLIRRNRRKPGTDEILPLTAPWHAESWRTEDGRTLYRVRTNDNVHITEPTEDGEFIAAICRSRNEGTELADVESLMERQAKALANRAEEMERFREMKAKEVGELQRRVYELMEQLYSLRERHGELEPGNKVLLTALREDLGIGPKGELPLFKGKRKETTR